MYSPKGGSQTAPTTPTPSNALYTPTETNAIALMQVGQGRGTNTISLRNQYNDYAIGMQEDGQQPMSFEEWAAANFPDQAILNQGG